MTSQKENRRIEIQKIMLARGNVSVKDLAEELKVTPETIRTDMNFLEKKSFLSRSHGGACLRPGSFDLPMDVRIQEHSEIKKAISIAAFDLIKDDMVIYIDSASTSLHLAKMMVLRKNITVYTDSLDIVAALSESHHSIILLGGIFNRSGRRTVGESARQQVSDVIFDLAFFGMDGCKDLDGPALQTDDELITDKEVLKRSRMNVLVADHTKLDMVAHYQFAKFSDISVFISDKLSPAYRSKIAQSIHQIIEV